MHECAINYLFSSMILGGQLKSIKFALIFKYQKFAIKLDNKSNLDTLISSKPPAEGNLNFCF